MKVLWNPENQKEMLQKMPLPNLLKVICRLRDKYNLSIDSIIEKLSKVASKEDVLKAYEIIQKHDTEADRLEVKKLIDKPLIVPPGLNSAVAQFESHFAVSREEPIMISGPTGVGKTLFLYLGKRLFKKQHNADEKVPPVVEANCGHFAGKSSDLNMARSELFGHVKGSHSLAKEDKKGLVEKANGGLLILEEVGELPFEVQAMLLTFIETGEYRRIGDEETRNSKVKIIAATNREFDLREDFRYRFFPYYIPPLLERKQDILYYFNQIFPDLTQKLTRSEVIVLLSHHWPGNVREIERIGMLLTRQNYYAQVANRDYYISHLNPKDTSFDPKALKNLNVELTKWGVDSGLVEKLLNKHRISLSYYNQEIAFPELSQKNDEFSWQDKFSLTYCNMYSPFTEAFEEFLRFCDLFLQNPSKDANILLTLRDCDSPLNRLKTNTMSIATKSTISKAPAHSPQGHLFKKSTKVSDYPKSYDDKIEKLKKSIMKFLKEVDKPDSELPKSIDEFWMALEKLCEKSKNGEPENSPLNMETLKEISTLKEDDLMRYYYKKLLEITGGNVRSAARRTGLEENTFRSRLYKLGIKSKKGRSLS
jgi:transcriptional regulator with AAA-type ATPase domain